MVDGYPLKFQSAGRGRYDGDEVQKRIVKIRYTCDACAKSRDVLKIDNCGGAYVAVHLCKKCLNKIIDTPKNSIMFA